MLSYYHAVCRLVSAGHAVDGRTHRKLKAIVEGDLDGALQREQKSC